jgi:hypothetical protein
MPILRLSFRQMKRLAGLFGRTEVMASANLSWLRRTSRVWRVDTLDADFTSRGEAKPGGVP